MAMHALTVVLTVMVLAQHSTASQGVRTEHDNPFLDIAVPVEPPSTTTTRKPRYARWRDYDSIADYYDTTTSSQNVDETGIYLTARAIGIAGGSGVGLVILAIVACLIMRRQNKAYRNSRSGLPYQNFHGNTGPPPSFEGRGTFGNYRPSGNRMQMMAQALARAKHMEGGARREQSDQSLPDFLRTLDDSTSAQSGYTATSNSGVAGGGRQDESPQDFLRRIDESMRAHLSSAGMSNSGIGVDTRSAADANSNPISAAGSMAAAAPPPSYALTSMEPPVTEPSPILVNISEEGNGYQVYAVTGSKS